MAVVKEIKVNPLQDTIHLLSRIAEATMLTHGQRLKVRDITQLLLDQSETALEEILDDHNAGEVFGNRKRYLSDVVETLPLTQCISLVVTKIDPGTFEIYAFRPPAKRLTAPVRVFASSANRGRHQQHDFNLQTRRAEFLGARPAYRSPSSDAKHSAMIAIQRNEERRLLVGRPRDAIGVIPLSLLHPAFSAFVKDCRTLKPSDTDIRLAHGLCEAMAKMYETEQERTNAFVRLINEHYDLEFRGSKIGKYATDGDLQADGYRYAILEVKRDVATNASEPYFQSALYYMHSTKDVAVDHFYDALPCVLVILNGESQWNDVLWGCILNRKQDQA